MKNHQIQTLNNAKTATFEARQELAGIAGVDAAIAYALTHAASLLLSVADSDLHPGYINEKVAKALHSINYAYGYMRAYRDPAMEVPIHITVDVECGCVSDTSVQVLSTDMHCTVDVIDHDAQEGSDGEDNI